MIMAFPTFHDIMLPLLKFVSDKKEKKYSEVMDHLAKHFQLSQEELGREKPSGGNQFYDRVAWAKNYLANAHLLEKKQGRFKITDKGVASLKQDHSKITGLVLTELVAYTKYVPKAKETPLSDTEKSPGDLIDEGISKINNLLSMDLLEKLKTVEPVFFEKLVLEVVEELGYGKGKHVGGPGDKGIDGEIPQDRLGLDMIYLQAKRYSSNVPAHDVRDFVGALALKKARKGIFITTSGFSKEAYNDMKNSEKNIILINGEKLVSYMIEHNVGVKTKKSLDIKEMDDGYFEEQ